MNVTKQSIQQIINCWGHDTSTAAQLIFDQLRLIQMDNNLLKEEVRKLRKLLNIKK